VDHVQGPAEFGATERSRDRRARALFEAIDDAVFVHDLQGNILDANPAACRRLGYTRDELLSMTTRDIDAPEFAAGFAQRLQNQLAGAPMSCEGRHVTRDGRVIPIDVNASMIEIDGKPAVLAVVRDVSRRKTSERRQAAQYAVTRTLAEATTLAEAASPVLQAIGEGLGWDVGVLWSVDQAADVLHCVDVWHAPSMDVAAFEAMTRQAAFAAGIGLPGLVWQRGKPMWLGDIVPEAGLPRTAVLAALGLRGAFAFPIRIGSETAGVIEFFSRSLERPGDDLRSMMAALGSQVGQFLDRKRVEEALRKSEAFYHSLVESIPQNILRKDREGRFTFANQRFCALLKRPLEQIVGKTDYDLFPRDLAEKYRADDRHVLETRSVLETVEEHQTPAGQTMYVQIVKGPIYDFQGEMIGTQVIFWDVTERKRWEEALRESERRYRQLTEAAQDGIIVTDQDGRVTLFNPSAERIFGYPAADVIGGPLERLIPAAVQEGRRRGFQRYLETSQTQVIGRPIELKGRRKEGAEFPLELSLSAIDVGGEPQFLGAIRDTTERNRMRTVLVQSEKLASIGLLSAGVAHEINNPLAYVANNLVVLERDVKSLTGLLDVYEGARAELARVNPAAAGRAGELAEAMDLAYVRDNLGRIFGRTREGVQRVSRIVQSLRGLARTAPPEMETTHLPDLVDMSLEMVRGRMQRQGIQLEVEYGPTEVRCVPTQFSQVLLNLIVNAVHAIEATPAPAAGKVRIASSNVGDEVLIEVVDNGCGIDAEHLPRLFDPFFTTKPVGEGTGLGLSITHTIVTGHGGRIEVDSRPGEGSRFRVFLPREPVQGRS
jgi:PAS domain S-box-containing protein